MPETFFVVFPFTQVMEMVGLGAATGVFEAGVATGVAVGATAGATSTFWFSLTRRVGEEKVNPLAAK